MDCAQADIDEQYRILVGNETYLVMEMAVNNK